MTNTPERKPSRDSLPDLKGKGIDDFHITDQEAASIRDLLNGAHKRSLENVGPQLDKLERKLDNNIPLTSDEEQLRLDAAAIEKLII